MPNVMVALPNIGGALSPVINAAKFGSRPLLECRAVTPPIGERKTWRTQSKLHLANYGATTAENIYSLPAQVTAKHRAKFGWPPLSDVAAVTMPRRESRSN